MPPPGSSTALMPPPPRRPLPPMASRRPRTSSSPSASPCLRWPRAARWSPRAAPGPARRPLPPPASDGRARRAPPTSTFIFSSPNPSTRRPPPSAPPSSQIRRSSSLRSAPPTSSAAGASSPAARRRAPRMGCSMSGLNALYDAATGGGDVWINERHFRVRRQIGEGGFAFVYLVKEHEASSDAARGRHPSHVSEDGTYAMKKVLIQSREQLDLVKEEIRVSSLFNHPNLLPLDHSVIAVKDLIKAC